MTIYQLKITSFIIIIPTKDSKNIIVSAKEYFFIIFFAFSPIALHKITSVKNLNPLENKLNKTKIGKEIPITPEVIAAIL